MAKNSTEKIRMGLTEYRGKEYVDLRVYYQAEGGEWKPTRKGLTLNPELWLEFVDGIQKLGKQLEEQGLLDSDN